MFNFFFLKKYALPNIKIYFVNFFLYIINLNVKNFISFKFFVVYKTLTKITSFKCHIDIIKWIRLVYINRNLLFWLLFYAKSETIDNDIQERNSDENNCTIFSKDSDNKNEIRKISV